MMIFGASGLGNTAANCGGKGNDTKSKSPLDRYVRPGGVDVKVS